MQLFALDNKKRLVPANRSFKGLDYNCLECGRIVRLRGGMHRQNHFYHLKPEHSCGLSGKSLTHLQVQITLERLFPPGEAILEKRFPAINRIADVVWEPQKLVFEVQCSGITAKEVEERNKDYAKEGYQVVWILHDRRFNQWRITAAEMFLRSSPHYFTNIDASGRGMIYDQFDLLERGVRKEKERPLKIDVAKPYIPRSTLSKSGREWSIGFMGDLTSLSPKHPYLLEVQKIQEEYFKEEEWSFRTLFQKYVVRPYFILFYALLEKYCR